jgi:aryl-alcohol dehydrogenase-like predicted oxidoreductase
MDYITLGRTGLRTSIMGLGSGGHSRVGQRTGKSESESVAVVQKALDLGINLIDTAEAYGTESIVGRAIKGVPRENVIVSTKKGLLQDDERVSAAEFAAGVEDCLRRLDTDYIDIFHLHGVRPDDYAYGREEILPLLLDFKQQGKLRFLGVTETFSADPQHRMVQQAQADDVWDVMMIGFNILNQSARERVFPHTMARDIGVLDMFAVRRAFSNPEHLRQVLRELVDDELLDPAEFDFDDPLGFLLEDGKADSLAEAAYRFCRYEPGVHVVLSGTGNPDHLVQNVESLLKPPLPAEDVERLKRIFARVDTVSGN